MQGMITIDGNSISITDWDGKTILDIARGEHIYIPTLCSFPGLTPTGTCRLCIVEIEGIKGYVPACTTPVEPGMNIRTTSPAIDEFRRNIIELILSEHPHFCITCIHNDACADIEECPTKTGQVTGCNMCEKRETCELREISRKLGVNTARYGFHYKNIPVERDDPFIERDHNLCILCSRCVRVCSEIRGFSAISLINKGSQVHISMPFYQSELQGSCTFCGSCIDVCPTGALSTRSTRWQIREKQTSACILCQMGCKIAADVKFDKILGISPVMDDPEDPGILCMYGHFAIPALVNSNARLKFPLVRKAGLLVPVTWDEAISYAAMKLKEYAPEQVGFMVSPFLSNEAAYVMQKFARDSFRSPNVFISSRQDISGIVIPVLQSLGTLDNINSIEQLEDSDVIIIVGSNDFFQSTLSASIFCAKKAGAKIIVIDPCTSELARWASINLHLVSRRYRAFLALLLKKILESRKLNKDFVKSRFTGFDALQSSLESITIPDLIAATGIDEKIVANVGNLVENARKLHVIIGSEMFHDPASSELVRFALDIVLLKDNPCGLTLFPEGGNWRGVIQMGILAGGLQGFLPASDDAALEKSPSMESMKALIMTENALPNEQVHPEFTILIDTHESIAMESADVVLPARSFTEIDGSFTPATGCTRFLKRISAFPGNAFPDHSILQVLGRTMDFDGFDWNGIADIQAEIEKKRDICSTPEKKQLNLLPILQPGDLMNPSSIMLDARRFRSVDLEAIVPDLKILRQKQNHSSSFSNKKILSEE